MEQIRREIEKEKNVYLILRFISHLQYHEFFMPTQIGGVSLYFELIRFENFARIGETRCYYDPINEQIPYMNVTE